MGTQQPDAAATFEAFNRLEHGMTYEQVCQILGCEGHLLFRIGGLGGVPETAMYSWHGKGIVGANMNATFKDGKLSSKAQFGMDQPAMADGPPTIETPPRDATSPREERRS